MKDLHWSNQTLVGSPGNKLKTILCNSWILCSRFFAPRALGNIGGAKGVKELIKLLKYDELDYSIRTEVIKGLGNIGSAQAIGPLTKLLKKEKNPQENHDR